MFIPIHPQLFLVNSRTHAHSQHMHKRTVSITHSTLLSLWNKK